MKLNNRATPHAPTRGLPALVYNLSTLLGAIALLLISACKESSPEENLRKTQLGGWITYWDYNNGFAVLESAPMLFNDVFFFTTHLDKPGQPKLHDSLNATAVRSSVALLKSKNIRTWMTVVNDVQDTQNQRFILKDSSTIASILQDSATQASHAELLTQLAFDFGFDGIDIDYENLHVDLLDEFTQFATVLAVSARNLNLKLSITVQPKTRDSNSIGPGAMDWKQLCRSADRVQIMLYNEHNAKTQPGPMATPTWIKEVLDYAVNQCPRERIVPVLKVSGMVWGQDDARGIQFVDVVSLVEQYQAVPQIDPRGQTPYFTYVESGVDYTVYYEDANSIKAKLLDIMPYKLQGAVLWSLGREDPAITQSLLQQRPQ